MFFLILIVFIAEIIIATTVILYILKLNDRVCELNSLVCYKHNKIKWMILDLRDNLQSINEEFDLHIEKANKKRNMIVFKILKGLAFSLFVFFLKSRYKKFMFVIQFLLLLFNNSKEDCKF